MPTPTPAFASAAGEIVNSGLAPYLAFAAVVSLAGYVYRRFSK